MILKFHHADLISWYSFGRIKSNVAPLIAEQYVRKPLRIKTLVNESYTYIEGRNPTYLT